MWTAAQCHQHYMSTPQYLSFLVSFLGVYGFKVLQFTVTYQVDFHPNFSHPWQYFTTSLLTRENRVSANGWTHPSSMTTVVVHSFIRKVTIVTLTILYSVVEVQDFNYTIADHFRGIYRIFSQLNKEKPEDVNLWLDGLGNTDWYIYIYIYGLNMPTNLSIPATAGNLTLRVRVREIACDVSLKLLWALPTPPPTIWILGSNRE